MKTRIPFSTISFNSREYLEHKLDELRRAKILSEWFFVPHKPEDDECQGKEHHHVFMIPSRGIQTDDIKQELCEYDPEHPTKPKSCLSFKSSKFGNWYLYAIHDPDYLAAKGESRKFHYNYDHVVASDPDVLYELVFEIDVTAELGALKGMQQAKKQGLTFQQFFNQGKVSPAQVRQYQAAWELVDAGATSRGSRMAHLIRNEDGDLINPETGEVVPLDTLIDTPNSSQKPRSAITQGSDTSANEIAHELDPNATSFGKHPKLREVRHNAMD